MNAWKKKANNRESCYEIQRLWLIDVLIFDQNSEIIWLKDERNNSIGLYCLYNMKSGSIVYLISEPWAKCRWNFSVTILDDASEEIL